MSEGKKSCFGCQNFREELAENCFSTVEIRYCGFSEALSAVGEILEVGSDYVKLLMPGLVVPTVRIIPLCRITAFFEVGVRVECNCSCFSYKELPEQLGEYINRYITVHWRKFEPGSGMHTTTVENLTTGVLNYAGSEHIEMRNVSIDPYLPPVTSLVIRITDIVAVDHTISPTP